LFRESETSLKEFIDFYGNSLSSDTVKFIIPYETKM